MKSMILILSFLNVLASHAAEMPRVSVTRFDQETAEVLESCKGWFIGGQRQLQSQLEHALSKKGFKVLERKSIRKIYDDEYELPNSNKRSQPKRGGFLSAQYTITGALTEVGICEESSETGVQVGGIVGLLGGPSGVDLEVGGGKAVSRVTMTAQVISVETGEVLQSFTAKGEIKDDKMNVGAGYAGIGAKHKRKTNLPIERASNQAIEDLANQIAEFLI